MLIELALAVLLGVFAGTLTGLAPGIHVNLVSAVLVTAAPALNIPVVFLAVFIIAIAVTHTFVDCLPSVFLGAPDADSALAVLPAHRLLLEGKGLLAIRLMVWGSILAMAGSVVLSPLFMLLLSFAYEAIRPGIPYAILAVAGFLIFRDAKPRVALLAFIVSGVLGLAVLSLPIRSALFPLLSGLFGAATLVHSLKDASCIPPQKSCSLEGHFIKPGFAAALTGGLTGVLPGIGSAAAAGMASAAWKRISSSEFLVLVGGINTANFFMSIWSYWLQDRARNGAIVGVRTLLGEIGWQHALLFVAVAFLASAGGALVALRLASWFAKIVPRIPYAKLCALVIGILVVLSVVLSGWLGLGVFVVSTALGAAAPLAGCQRVHLMGCILLPVAVFLLT